MAPFSLQICQIIAVGKNRKAVATMRKVTVKVNMNHIQALKIVKPKLSLMTLTTILQRVITPPEII